MGIVTVYLIRENQKNVWPTEEDLFTSVVQNIKFQWDLIPIFPISNLLSVVQHSVVSGNIYGNISTEINNKFPELFPLEIFGSFKEFLWNLEQIP